MDAGLFLLCGKAKEDDSDEDDDRSLPLALSGAKWRHFLQFLQKNSVSGLGFLGV